MLTDDESFLWTNKAHPEDLSQAVLREVSLAYLTSLGPIPAQLNLGTYALMCEAARGDPTVTRLAWREWQYETFGADFYSDGCRRQWAVALYARARSSYAAGSVVPMTREEENSRSAIGYPPLRGVANYLALHTLEPGYMSADIKAAHESWLDGSVEEEWNVALAAFVAMEATADDPLIPTPFVITPFADLAAFATLKRWVHGLQGCSYSRCVALRFCCVSRDGAPRHAITSLYDTETFLTLWSHTAARCTGRCSRRSPTPRRRKPT
jgi:hypothetical protein